MGCDWWLERKKERGREQRWREEKPLKNEERCEFRIGIGMRWRLKEMKKKRYGYFVSCIEGGRYSYLFTCLHKLEGCDWNSRVKEKLTENLAIGEWFTI